MEIELKLKFMEDDGAKEFLNDEEIMKNAIDFKEIAIKAEYLDTYDGILNKNLLALRKRKEGNKLFATVKSMGTQENGLSRREEYNIEINRLSNDIISEFSNLPIGEDIKKILEGKELITIVSTNYIRNKFNLKMYGCVTEIAVDKGEIIANGLRESINEVEIEYLEGDEEGIIKIGEFFKSRHNLSPGNKSKFERGLNLIKKDYHI